MGEHNVKVWADSVEHLTRWDDKRGHFYPASKSAQNKLAAVLLPVFQEWDADGSRVHNARVYSLQSAHRYAVRDVNNAIDKANSIATELAELGVAVNALPRVAEGDES